MYCFVDTSVGADGEARRKTNSPGVEESIKAGATAMPLSGLHDRPPLLTISQVEITCQ